ncbi:lipocalin-like domain-containing protein [Curvibacter gracilis]|uniref:lipocalin-like domain-containing protein n=1 Tax=Curvibacter gracilis TaxID=230310 RepID=UPI0004816724|nr:lipocalin-like domain-containing protein [Curvibacter gracilis]
MPPLTLLKRRQFNALAWSLMGASVPVSAQLNDPKNPKDPPPARTALKFPKDFGSHPEQAIEWWYVTGSARSGQRVFGYQVTFFRSRVRGVPKGRSAFVPEQLVFAHAALTDVQGKQLWHDQRSARAGMGLAGASTQDTDVHLHPWSFRRVAHNNPADSHYEARVQSDAFELNLDFKPSQALLLQGLEGYSQKGPQATQFSRYYSEPQMSVQGHISLHGQRFVLDADTEHRAWLDHEWSDELMAPDAQGWDWMGLNFLDGSALMAFRMRDRGGKALWDASTWRDANGKQTITTPGQVQLIPGRRWRSPKTQAEYPIEWKLVLPGREFVVKAVIEDQELDSRASTGAIYWEGLCEVFDLQGRRLGRGYVELTGYAQALRL